MNKTCYMMIGLPGSGKSTESKKLSDQFPELKIVSTDQYIEDFAKQVGKTYNDVFQQAEKEAQKLMKAQLRNIFENEDSFIWDQTNVNPNSRKKKLARLQQEKYAVIAIAIEVSSEELTKRLNTRIINGGKKISTKIINEMVLSYQRPSYSDGFSEIYLIQDDSIKTLIKQNDSKNKI